LFDLIHAVNNVLKRFQHRDEPREIFEDKWTVSEKLELLRRLIAARGMLRFSELFEQTASRTEVVVTFLALLELIRLKHITVGQQAPFGEIEIWRGPAFSAAAMVTAPDAAGAGSNLRSEGSNSQT
jgi:segregation and condensation protein A